MMMVMVAPRLRKVAAHRQEDSAMSEEEVRHVRGNAHADEWAKKAAKALSGYDQQDEASVLQERQHWRSVALLMLRTLALWPSSKEIWGKLEREVRPPAERSPHTPGRDNQCANWVN